MKKDNKKLDSKYDISEEINDALKDLDNEFNADFKKINDMKKALDFIAPITNIRLIATMLIGKAKREESDWAESYGNLIIDSCDFYMETLLKEAQKDVQDKFNKEFIEEANNKKNEESEE